MQARTVSAPAKINVILEVLGRRADGYHDLWSVLVLVDLCDTVTVAPRKRGILLTVRPAPRKRGILLTVHPPVVPAGPGNLAFRAAEAFFETWGRPGGAAITLRKRIPVGGGLGGGSSDAAAVLAALNAMTGRPLTRERLLDLAAGLGSDVPFFFSGGAALITGRGEQVADLPSPPPRWLVLAPSLAGPGAGGRAGLHRLGLRAASTRRAATPGSDLDGGSGGGQDGEVTRHGLQPAGGGGLQGPARLGCAEGAPGGAGGRPGRAHRHRSGPLRIRTGAGSGEGLERGPEGGEGAGLGLPDAPREPHPRRRPARIIPLSLSPGGL
ncbi:MAG: 4-(cytidine 5'-diphospho)-2-C-methyl-D-erythritol kinase [candidate division NC10 bacterium]|nr:4-(cytidine 5'-diphospho)-2-C-methyl-D-erythritol kinase [candidate division NC10 bacterium]